MGFRIRLTQVCEISDLSTHMRRIVLKGDDLNDFPEDLESAHVKVVVPKPGESRPNLGFGLGLKKRMRSYTIRKFDKVHKQLTIDFAVNDHQGMATDWAKSAQVGDYLGIAGPGKTKHTDYFAHWHLLIGDLTALPAIAATLDKMPASARGYVLVQVPSAEDVQELRIPTGMTIKWIISGDPSKQALVEETKLLEWQPGTPAILIAADSSQVKAAHRYVKSMPDFDKKKLYASAYWTS